MSGPVLIEGDCAALLPAIPSASVDALLTDPPAGIGFMGKAWDSDKGGRDAWVAWLEGVMRETLRTLKPGAHALVWALPRTSHWTASALENAGFDVRDVVVHLFGTGFPKSLDVSKAIDKAGGMSPREQSELVRARREAAGLSRADVAARIGCTESSVRDWEEGRARAVGRSLEWITPIEEYRSKLADLLGYSQDEREAVGAAQDRRGDASTLGLGHSGQLTSGGHTPASKQWAGWGTALKPAAEHWILARKPLVGTVAANVLAHGTGALNIDACRVGTEGGTKRSHQAEYARTEDGKEDRSQHWARTGHTVEAINLGRWPANVTLDEDAAALLDAQSGTLTSGALNPYTRSTTPPGYELGMAKAGREVTYQSAANSGGASRFFYVAKPSKAERGEGNVHPTVKPLALMRYLARLITPPGGLVLDPFAGSGTTALACAAEGFRFIGMELDPAYIAIARTRLGI